MEMHVGAATDGRRGDPESAPCFALLPGGGTVSAAEYLHHEWPRIVEEVVHFDAARQAWLAAERSRQDADWWGFFEAFAGPTGPVQVIIDRYLVAVTDRTYGVWAAAAPRTAGYWRAVQAGGTPFAAFAAQDADE